MTEMRVRLTLPALLGLALLAGCEPPPPPFPTPPPLLAEILPKPPVSETRMMWQPGDWDYTGGSYRYEPGHYVPVEGHGPNWVFGHWVPSEAGPVWVPGGWL